MPAPPPARGTDPTPKLGSLIVEVWPYGGLFRKLNRNDSESFD